MRPAQDEKQDARHITQAYAVLLMRASAAVVEEGNRVEKNLATGMQMDGRLLAARLGPKAARWNTLSGGQAEFSSQDIAAALGMIKDDFGRELFCHLWCPGNAHYTAAEIERMILHQVLSQCKDRAVQALVTQLTCAIAELEQPSVRRRASGTALSGYRKCMEDAKCRRWPSPSPVYQRLARSVLMELGRSACCGQCQGLGQILVGAHLVACPRCGGSGEVFQSDLSRARALQMTWHAYSKAWKEPYEWALAHCMAATRSASNALCRHLGYPPIDRHV